MIVIRLLEHLPCEDRLRAGFQSGEGKALGKLLLFHCIKEAYKKDGERPFTRACSDRTRLMVSN